MSRNMIMLLLCEHLVLFSLMLAPCVSSSSPSSNKAFIAVSTNDTLVIQPPQGGFVSIVNFPQPLFELRALRQTSPPPNFK